MIGVAEKFFPKLDFEFRQGIFSVAFGFRSVCCPVLTASFALFPFEYPDFYCRMECSFLSEGAFFNLSAVVLVSFEAKNGMFSEPLLRIVTAAAFVYGLACPIDLRNTGIQAAQYEI